MEMSIFSTEEMTQAKAEAIELHYEIRKNGELAAVSMVEFCKGLKKMRDTKLYTELGFETFEKYAEGAIGLEQRQAYYYIQILEKLGESVLQSNANLGVTKLSLLCKIPWQEREEFMQKNPVEEMTTRELKAAVEKATAAVEQLTFLTGEHEKLKEKHEELDSEYGAVLRENEEYETAIKQLQHQLKEAQSKPAAVVKEPISKEEKERITKKAVAEAQKQAAEDKKNALEKAESKKKAEIEELERKYQAMISKLENEKATSAAKLQEVEKSSKVAENPLVLEFSFHFKEAQSNINAMQEILAKVDAETKERLIEALKAVAELISEVTENA